MFFKRWTTRKQDKSTPTATTTTQKTEVKAATPETTYHHTTPVPQRPQIQAAIERGSFNILYVEDDTNSRQLMKMLYDGASDNVIIWDDSDNFLTKLERLNPQPDIFLVDIHLPSISGVEILQLLRTTSPYEDSVIVALTASVTTQEVAELRTAGFDSILSKPINTRLFQKTLKAICDGQTRF
ncbi:MAG: response regulator [Chloroflexota bacterium]